MRESVFQKQLVDGLKSVGAWVFNVHGGSMQRPGIPDLYIAHPRWTGWVELKVGNNKPSFLQIINMKDLLRRQVGAFVVRHKEDVVYCELWKGEDPKKDKMTLSYADGWQYSKGATRGLSLLEMFEKASKLAVEEMQQGSDVIGSDPATQREEV